MGRDGPAKGVQLDSRNGEWVERQGKANGNGCEWGRGIEHMGCLNHVPEIPEVS